MTTPTFLQHFLLLLLLVSTTTGSPIEIETDEETTDPNNQPVNKTIVADNQPLPPSSSSPPSLPSPSSSSPLPSIPSSSSPNPIFLEGPQSEDYLLKGHSLSLKCKATHTERINFKCNNVWMDPTSHNAVLGEMMYSGDGGAAAGGGSSGGGGSSSSGGGSSGGSSDGSGGGDGSRGVKVKYLETSIVIPADQLETIAVETNEWTCECHAWLSDPLVNHSLTIKSNSCTVRTPYMRRHFEREPLSASVALQSTMMLHCLPPLADPPADVFWLKNGVELDVTDDTNLIISNEGNLIFNQVRLREHGNYTCGAVNMVAKRFSEAAVVNVYVDGEWSNWSPWSECSSCPRSHQRRSRTCTDPSPQNGGTPCQGEVVQRVLCPGLCTDDYLTSGQEELTTESSIENENSTQTTSIN